MRNLLVSMSSTKVLTMPPLQAVSGGPDFTCGILYDTRAAKCWGMNSNGRATPPTGTDVAAGYSVSTG